jgi:hypothetical protein
VLDATTVPLECVVVDDGSTDATASVAARLAASDPRIVVIRSPANEGASAARNRALAVARGEWLTFLDADDRLRPGGLAAMLDAATSEDALVVVGQRIWTDGRTSWRSRAYDIPDIRRPGRASLASRPGLLYYASATGKLFHRSITDGLRFEGRVLGDQAWPVRAMVRAADRIVVIGADVYEWRRPSRRSRASSITAARGASAVMAAEATRVAIGALAEVATEVALRIADPVERERVVGAYFERLVRSDIAGAVRRAVSRGDAGSETLFAAVGDFLAAAPAEFVDASDAVAQDVLRAPLERWLRFREPGRGAWWQLAHSVLAEHPGLAARTSRGTLLGPALAIVRRSSFAPSGLGLGLLVALDWPFGLARRALRLARLGIVRLRTIGPAPA